MFASVGLARFLRTILYVNAALAIAVATNFFGWLPSVPYASAVSISVIAVSAILFLIGETPFFPRICSLPCVWRLFPNIDGEYGIEISSNWSVIKARLDGREPEVSAEGDVPLLKKVGRARIVARLTRISMSLQMDDGYLTSETATCSLQRQAGERQPVLFYIYDSHVAVPKDSDSDHHIGAARIVVPLSRRPKCLEGNYWTNRNWHQGKNTAGRIRLTRVEAGG